MIKEIFYVVVILLLFSSAYLFYNFYNDYLSSPVNLHVNYTQLQTIPSYSGNLQFYDNMLFNHTDLSYMIGSECSQNKIKDMQDAFSYLSDRTGVISFHPVTGNEEISVRCGQQYLKGDLYVAGEGGPDSIINASGFDIIQNGKILLLYDKASCPATDYDVALHELLHVLGFNHSSSKTSIMYPVSACDQVLTNDIVDEIKRLYSIPVLPDFTLGEVSANKRGSYLNLNFSIKNIGIANSAGSSVVLYSSSSKVETFDMGPIEAGAGKIFFAQNVKVSSSSLKLVVIDGQELNYENNNVSLSLP